MIRPARPLAAERYAAQAVEADPEFARAKERLEQAQTEVARVQPELIAALKAWEAWKDMDIEVVVDN